MRNKVYIIALEAFIANDAAIVLINSCFV